jgi:hypothetical protein
MTHILRALDRTGKEFFYTGRAGAGWVSQNKVEAFTYTMEGAQRKAQIFNAGEALHGFWFIAIDLNRDAEAA